MLYAIYKPTKYRALTMDEQIEVQGGVVVRATPGVAQFIGEDMGYVRMVVSRVGHVLSSTDQPMHGLVGER